MIRFSMNVTKDNLETANKWFRHYGLADFYFVKSNFIYKNEDKSVVTLVSTDYKQNDYYHCNTDINTDSIYIDYSGNEYKDQYLDLRCCSKFNTDFVRVTFVLY